MFLIASKESCQLSERKLAHLQAKCFHENFINKTMKMPCYVALIHFILWDYHKDPNYTANHKGFSISWKSNRSVCTMEIHWYQLVVFVGRMEGSETRRWAPIYWSELAPLPPSPFQNPAVGDWILESISTIDHRNHTITAKADSIETPGRKL